MMVDPHVGHILSNRYRIVETIGQGSMGRVYRAEDTLLGDVPVAIKFLSQTLLNEKMRDRFNNEALACAGLGQKSIHIVRVTDYGVSRDEIPYYVMEYLKGENLGELVNNQPLPVPRFLGLARQVCLGLQCAHQGIKKDGRLVPIIHRDIKPSNILITQDPSFGELAKILDFGIAKLMQADSDQTNCFMGTLAYASPEQMEGQELDGRSDIYSLGIMMYQMLTGKMPIRADTHTFGGWYKAHHYQQPRPFEQALPDLKLPKALEGLVFSCLEKDMRHRPQDMTEVLRSLEPLEQRFGTGRQISHKIGAALSKLPVQKIPKATADLSADEICRLTTWPKDKPIAEIVFPHILQTSRGPLATLWVMLHKKDILERLTCTRYNQFLCTMSPHPMALWITALHRREAEARWLPCYLDLKTKQGQEVIRLLSQQGKYRILFFALEEPNRCADVKVSNIALEQQPRLQQWANQAYVLPTANQANFSKQLLKQELEKLKPKIIRRLEALYAEDSSDISGYS